MCFDGLVKTKRTTYEDTTEHHKTTHLTSGLRKAFQAHGF